MATKTELKEAFGRARGFDTEGEQTLAEFLTETQVEVQERLDRRRAELQAELDRLPATALERMKDVAVEQLYKELEAGLIADNEGVTL